MDEYKIDIIIPVYNNQDVVERCLKSLIAQTFSSWRALIVDDASTDGSAAIVKKYAAKDSRFIYLRNEKNLGVARTRNRALSMLRSEYAAFLDADDVWEKEMLAALYGCVEKYDADVVQCRFVYDLPGGKRILPKGAFRENVLLEGKPLRRVYRRMMTGINMNHVCMKLIRSSLISGLRFDTELKTAEDLDFCIRLFHNVKRYYFTTAILYHYYRGHTSLTGGGLSFSQKFSANRRVSRTLAKALPVWGIDNLFYRTLSYLRPYVIIVSKAFRTIREKIVAGAEKGKGVGENETA